MRVYLSSTLIDLASERQAVRDALTGEYTVIESYEADPRSLWSSCLSDIATCDIFIGIIGLRYGFVPEGQSKSITELEFDEAIARGIRCFLFLKNTESITANFTDIFTKEQNSHFIESFRERLSSGSDGIPRPAKFSSCDQLTKSLLKALLRCEFRQQYQSAVKLISNAGAISTAGQGITNTTKENASRRRGRFVHSTVFSDDWLKAAVLGNPYFTEIDPTEHSKLPENENIQVMFWVPHSNYFEGKKLSKFTPAAIICSPNPDDILDYLKSELEQKVYKKIDLPPGKLFNEDRQKIFGAIGQALKNSFVACILVPETLLAPSKFKSSMGFHTLVDLLFSPVCLLNKELGVGKFNVYVSDAGGETNFVIGRCKRVAKAVFQKTETDFKVDSAKRSTETAALSQIARLLAWAAASSYNSSNFRWIQILERGLSGVSASTSRMEMLAPE